MQREREGGQRLLVRPRDDAAVPAQADVLSTGVLDGIERLGVHLDVHGDQVVPYFAAKANQRFVERERAAYLALGVGLDDQCAQPNRILLRLGGQRLNQSDEANTEDTCGLGRLPHHALLARRRLRLP
jgi:hypothetical protein